MPKPAVAHPPEQVPQPYWAERRPKARSSPVLKVAVLKLEIEEAQAGQVLKQAQEQVQRQHPSELDIVASVFSALTSRDRTSPAQV